MSLIAYAFPELLNLLVRPEILMLSVNTIIADGKYSCHFQDSFPQPTQGQLFKKPKNS